MRLRKRSAAGSGGVESIKQARTGVSGAIRAVQMASGPLGWAQERQQAVGMP